MNESRRFAAKAFVCLHFRLFVRMLVCMYLLRALSLANSMSRLPDPPTQRVSEPPDLPLANLEAVRLVLPDHFFISVIR
ncbi:unnamed protein product [Protopolystoma xenopodis]|uniref:Uncharacterized protein n=1 Tax=Protopolystoma xenopodis TaxID=117903 RepID=A0A448WGR0_9PLAT|nr:unnamed protein product [Protopolystoma xenopodis]